MTTAMLNTPSASSGRYTPREASSLTLPAWAVARSLTPQPVAALAASASAGVVISSMASTWGVMARMSIAAASGLGAPVITSVQGPTSKSGRPSQTPAASPRSSMSETRRPPSETRRTSSRRSVVLPAPGGEMMSVSGSPASSSRA